MQIQKVSAYCHTFRRCVSKIPAVKIDHAHGMKRPATKAVYCLDAGAMSCIVYVASSTAAMVLDSFVKEEIAFRTACCALMAPSAQITYNALDALAATCS